MASNLQRCIACGMDDHLTKPCTRDALEATLRKWAM
jgi:CheY-like chemotaxis protein